MILFERLGANYFNVKDGFKSIGLIEPVPGYPNRLQFKSYEKPTEAQKKEIEKFICERSEQL